jgi:hypothetical protein
MSATGNGFVDPFLGWLEGTPISTWLSESPSLMGLPFMLVLHTIGLAFLVGASVAIDARILGLARGVPLLSLRPYYRVMWTGFWVNAVSGVLLLIAFPTKALTNPVFYLKLTVIAAALAIGRAIRLRMMNETVAADAGATGALKVLAVASLVCWVAGITAGRLLAYTCTRSTVVSSCR